MIKSVLIMLDDVVNEFSKTLKSLGVDYHNNSDNIADRDFTKIFFNRDGTLTETAIKAFGETPPRADGISFVNSFKKKGTTVVLCTSRDIRLCCSITKDWLSKNGVLYDYLFTATAPAGLCKDMDIPFMIYNLPDVKFNDEIFAVDLRNKKNGEDEPCLPEKLCKFKSFEEAEIWMKNLNL